MIKKIQKHMNNRKGFTLIELIVVIVILGILAAILVPTFASYVNRADQAADDALLANIKTALSVAYLIDGADDNYAIVNGKAPTDVTTDSAKAVLAVIPKATTGATLLTSTYYSNKTVTFSIVNNAVDMQVTSTT